MLHVDASQCCCRSLRAIESEIEMVIRMKTLKMEVVGCGVDEINGINYPTIWELFDNNALLPRK